MVDYSSPAYYVRTWENLLGQLLKWSPAQVWEWTECTGKLAALRDSESLIYHQTPLYWALPALIDAFAATKSPGLCLQYQNDLLHVFYDAQWDGLFPLDTDWTSFLPKIRRVFASAESFALS